LVLFLLSKKYSIKITLIYGRALLSGFKGCKGCPPSMCIRRDFLSSNERPRYVPSASLPK